MRQIRVKAFRRLLCLLELRRRGELFCAEQIMDMMGVSKATAYDYWHTIKRIEDIFSE